MPVFLSPVGGAGAQFFDNNGDPLSGGKLFTYQAGTTTPLSTYTTSSGTVAHTNPIILNAAGRVPSGGEIWLGFAPTKFIMKTSNDVLIATWDNVSGLGASQYVADTLTGNGSQIAFTLSAGPYSVGSMLVYINGVYQNRSSYTIAGTTLTFSEAPPATSTIEVLYR